jgi:anti-sigma factor RsiW
MKSCKFPKTWLMAWLDDEMDEHAKAAREHLKDCRECAHEVEAWRVGGERLRDLIDRGVGEVEPLLALEKIHARIAAAEEMPWFDRVRRGWAELWLLHRKAFAGAAVAAALGMLTAPAAIYFLARVDGTQINQVQNAVVVESLEVGGNGTAVVLSADDSDTTIIWVESDANADATDESL